MKNIKRPKRHNRRPAVGNNHPPPNASELWAHVETIKRMRLGRRRSWVQISEALRDEGVDVAPVTIYNFLKRYARRARAGTLPSGSPPSIHSRPSRLGNPDLPARRLFPDSKWYNQRNSSPKSGALKINQCPNPLLIRQSLNNGPSSAPKVLGAQGNQPSQTAQFLG